MNRISDYQISRWRRPVSRKSDENLSDILIYFEFPILIF